MSEERADSPKVRIPPPLVFAGALALGFALERVFPLRRRKARLAGAALIAAGAVLGGWARILFLKRGTTVLPFRPASALVEDGPFRISRNPIYVGFTAIYAGTSLLRRSTWPLLLLPGVVLVIDSMVIDREEAYLERRFGEDYLAYKAKVHRWL
ncbi:MAG TPA: isoprenylcysteine carboxylmethyltransferase family protein [Bryocella sp.]|nr:isoprenylcysteine carboxylmethyltransferase family protein [Bryocella sp.]